MYGRCCPPFTFRIAQSEGTPFSHFHIDQLARLHKAIANMRPLPHMRHDATLRLDVSLKPSDVAGPKSGEIIRGQLAIQLLEIHCCQSSFPGLHLLRNERSEFSSARKPERNRRREDESHEDSPRNDRSELHRCPLAAAFVQASRIAPCKSMQLKAQYS